MAPSSGCVVTVGTYDGVHLGHRRLLAEAMQEGARRGLSTVAVTFDRHPAEVLRPDHAPRLLTGLSHKLELLASTGVDDVEVLRFDRERAAESPEDFVLNDLVGRLGAKAILVGANFRFGHGQTGSVATLEELAPAHGFVARGIGLLIDDETHSVISSSAIRAQLAAGEVGEAARLLGRPHEVRGTGAGGFVLESRLQLPALGEYVALVGPPEAPTTEARVFVTQPDRLELVDEEGRPLQMDGPLAVRFLARLGDEPVAPLVMGSEPESRH